MTLLIELCSIFGQFLAKIYWCHRDGICCVLGVSILHDIIPNFGILQLENQYYVYHTDISLLHFWVQEKHVEITIKLK